VTPEILEQIEILRRVADRGMEFEYVKQKAGIVTNDSIDLWQHMLDEIDRLKGMVDE